MSLAENIKKRRLELGMSQQELADAVGYKSRSTIAKIEAGENTVPGKKIKKFATILDTTEEYIRNGGISTALLRSREVTEKEESEKRSDEKRTIAIILAGGKSTRNLQNIPNQFINVLGKPVIIYTLEAYEKHPSIDDIYVVCLKGWDTIVSDYARQYGISKLRGIIPAGETGALSAMYAVKALNCKEEDIIVFQESTRPLITEEIISKLLHAYGRAGVVCEPMDDHVQFLVEGSAKKYVSREKLYAIQSPEAYDFGLLREAHEKAAKNNHRMDETCCSMLMYNLGYNLNFIEGNHNNIKAVRQEDIAILNALLKSRG